MRTSSRAIAVQWTWLGVAFLAGCNSIAGINDFSVIGGAIEDGPTGQHLQEPADAADSGAVVTPGDDGPTVFPPDDASDATFERIGECDTNAQCTARASADAGPDGGTVPSICLQPEGKCVPLLSEDCTTVTGDYNNDNAIILGSLFSTKGPQAATNLPRQQSATMAIEEINAAGGIPKPASGTSPQPLVMVSCDEATMLQRAGGHLINDLRVPAIVGPNISQDEIDLSSKLSVQAGTLVISPTAVASGIADLLDNDLTWLMVPNDVQRAPLMIKQINDLESKLLAERNKSSIKLGIIYRNDALGIGTRTSLNDLVLNGKALSDPLNAGTASGNVKLDGYDSKLADQNAIVTKYRDFAPDIIILAGTAEAITKVMTPLEAQWTYDGGAPSTSRPYYLLIDSAKVPELLAAVKGNDELRGRIRGTGITPGPASTPVANAFNIDYLTRWGVSPTASGMGPSYDATYALAYALAATRDLPVSGSNIAKGLRKLAGSAPTIQTGNQQVLAAFQQLAGGGKITGIGTFGPLEWDRNGAALGGTIEMWCIGAPTGTAAYQTSGYTYDIKTKAYAGAYTQCQ